MSSQSSSPEMLPTTASSLVFDDSLGILENVLSFSDTQDLLAATLVNRRWKDAGRRDDLWKSALLRAWKDKRGVACHPVCNSNLIFWRTLLSKEAVRSMTKDHVFSIFQHPLLHQKWASLQTELARLETENEETQREALQRFFQLHMLDIMSEGDYDDGDQDTDDDDDSHRNQQQSPPRQTRHFFSDLYFGSFASSMMDARRICISQLELCSPHGFEMHFKMEADDVDADLAETNDDLQRYRDEPDILLYRHSTCYFQQDREFQIVLHQHVHDRYRPAELQWRWIELGKRIQVGPYPSLTVSRRKDWGWKLENAHVVMYSLDGSGSAEIQDYFDNQNNNADNSNDVDSDSASNDSGGVDSSSSEE